MRRGCSYEAVCVWSFMSLMMEYLKNQAILSSQEQMKRGALHRNDSASVPLNPETVTLVHVHALLEREKSIPHMWGLSRLLPKLGWSDRWKMGEEFLQKCRLGVLQFVPVQMAATLATALCEHQHSYHEGRWSWHSGYAYVTPIRALSQGIALYCLVYFYHGTEELLTEINPLAKFLSIKLVIFFTFWQVCRRTQGFGRSRTHPALTFGCGRAECCIATDVRGRAAHFRKSNAAQVLAISVHVLLQQLHLLARYGLRLRRWF